MPNSAYKIVCIDMDGTLVRSTTTSLFIASKLGKGDFVRNLDERFTRYDMSAEEYLEATASLFAGLELEEVISMYDDIPVIDGIEPVVEALHAAGMIVLICTVTWEFAAGALQRRFGFDGRCGAEMHIDKGILTGRIKRHFNEFDKRNFVHEQCSARGILLSECVTIGDSRSDVPLFQISGLSVALNATTDAKAFADVSIDALDLRATLPYVVGGTTSSSFTECP